MGLTFSCGDIARRTIIAAILKWPTGGCEKTFFTCIFRREIRLLQVAKALILARIKKIFAELGVWANGHYWLGQNTRNGP